MSTVARYLVHVGTLNESEERQFAVMMMMNARLSPEAQANFIIQVTNAKEKNNPVAITLTFPVEIIEGFLKSTHVLEDNAFIKRSSDVVEDSKRSGDEGNAFRLKDVERIIKQMRNKEEQNIGALLARRNTGK